MSRRKRYAVLTALASAALGGGILTAATAGPTESRVLTDVATANTRSDGYAPSGPVVLPIPREAELCGRA